MANIIPGCPVQALLIPLQLQSASKKVWKDNFTDQTVEEFFA